MLSEAAARAIAGYAIESKVFYRGAKAILATVVEDVLYDERGGTVPILESDVRTAVGRLTSGVVEPAPASAAVLAEPMLDGVADAQTERAAGG